jgi:hypothetical protein
MTRSKKGKKRDTGDRGDNVIAQDTGDQTVEDAAPSDALLTWLGASTAEFVSHFPARGPQTGSV